ncbi:MAG: hypothetical protein DMG23_10740 [Acidobacteria bacterium]|nr:MAG: hypothetical protein DMG23_10740 [Acidobacteriota bacterium]
MRSCSPRSTFAQGQNPPETDLATAIRSAKIYKLPEETKAGTSVEDLVIYRKLSYQDSDGAQPPAQSRRVRRPLAHFDGKVLALAGGADECIPIELSRSLME